MYYVYYNMHSKYLEISLKLDPDSMGHNNFDNLKIFPIVVLVFISLITSESGNFFHIFIVFCVFSLSIICSYPLPIFLLNCLSFSWFVDLYIFWNPYRLYVLQIPSPCLDILYILFWFREILNSTAVKFINISFMVVL